MAKGKWHEKYLKDRECAKRQAAAAWKKTHSFAPVAIDPKVQQLLTDEFPSVRDVYRNIVTMALSYPSDYLRDDGTAHGQRVIVEDPGGRRWGQRVLAEVCKLSLSTIQFALSRLRELGLIFTETSRRWGTYIFVKGFEKMSRLISCRAAVQYSGSSSRVPMESTFPLRKSDLKPIIASIDVPDVDTGKKYRIKGMIADVFRMLNAIDQKV